MYDYQRAFLDFAVERGVLRFGQFTLKSGRNSPYFFNSGLFNSGDSLARLGRAYADAISASGIAFDMLYGPAYKGIPLVAAVAIAFADQHNRDLPYAFNRKEAKDHGEGGTIVGAPLQGRILIVDDVVSAGTSARESLDLIHASGATPAAIAVCLDRQERGTGSRSAIQELEADHGLRAIRIVGLDELITWLEEKGDRGDEVARIRAYREEYGA